MANQNTPIPQNPIGENFVWRDWFQKLSNRVYGSMGTQESTNVSITGGTIDGTAIGSSVPSTGHFTSLQLNTPLAILYGGTSSNTAAGARTNLGVTATGLDTTYAYRANNLSDLASASTARTNLGLGTMAVANTSSYSTTGTDTTYSYRAYALTAGTGISYSSGTTFNGSANITINNSGVTSIIAGTGISVSSATGAVTVSQSSTTTKAYGAFHDTTTQTAAVINTAYAVTFDSTDLSSGVASGTPTSRIVITNAGTYNIQFSAQINKTTANKKSIWIWADVNGTSIPYSATEVTIAGSSAALVAAWNFVLPINAGDYFRLMWSTDDLGCQIVALAASAPVPGIPSIILTVQQI